LHAGPKSARSAGPHLVDPIDGAGVSHHPRSVDLQPRNGNVGLSNHLSQLGMSALTGQLTIAAIVSASFNRKSQEI
jgi:hypothetical protein